jgi:hypothetical protein
MMRFAALGAGLLAVAAVMPARAAPTTDATTAEPDATFVALFGRYMTVRRQLDLSGLEKELRRAELEGAAEHDYQRLFEIARRVDLAPILRFQSADAASNMNICLSETHCRWYALYTLRSWATVKHTVTRISRDDPDGRVELHYSGVDGTGMSGRGSVVFVREAGEWKIGAESFGPEGSMRKAGAAALPGNEAF